MDINMTDIKSIIDNNESYRKMYLRNPQFRASMDYLMNNEADQSLLVNLIFILCEANEQMQKDLLDYHMSSVRPISIMSTKTSILVE